ncbi:MAG: hypothetical protein Q7K21_02520, partial [Elusimicrobiota bacterium]|nr:hypothetical protein [Elusimicrobiota bacterium]
NTIKMTLQDLTWGASVWSGSQWLAGAVDGSTRVVCSFVSQTGSPPLWTYNYSVGASTMVSGHKYEVRVWAKDNAGNWTNGGVGEGNGYGVYIQAPGAGSTDTVKRFWYESTPPNSAITSQTNGSRYSTLGMLSGNAQDTGAVLNAGIASLVPDGGIKILISNSADDNSGFYFLWASTGTMQTGSANWITVDNNVSGNWDKTLLTCVDFAQNTTYWIRVKSKDAARPSGTDSVTDQGNEESPAPFVWITWDSEKPKVFTTQPDPTNSSTGNNGRMNSLTTISGTCVDNGTIAVPNGKIATSGGIELNIVDLDGGPATWNGLPTGWAGGDNPNTWVSTSTFIGVSSGTWTYSVPVSSWTNAHKYRIRVRAKDASNPANYTTTGICVSTFTYDTAPPVTGVSYPSGTPAYLKLLTGNINGTTDDIYTTLVQLKIRRNDGWTYDGSVFADDGVPNIYDSGGNWKTVTLTPTTWNYSDLTEAKLTDGYRYEVLTKSQDLATNLENISSPLKALTTFYFDTTIPVKSTITYPTSTPATDIAQIRGDCADPITNYYNTGIAEVNIRIRDTENYLPGNATYWNGAGGWVEDLTHNTAAIWRATTLSSNATGWWWPGATGDTVPDWTSNKIYEISAKAKDRALNWGTNYSTQTFKRDTAPPTVAINKPSTGELYRNSVLSITGNATDPGTTSKIKEVHYAVRDLTLGATWWTGAAWLSGTDTTYWVTLTSTPVQYFPDGTNVTWSTGAVNFASGSGHYYRISARAMDVPGNTTAVADHKTKYLYYDTQAPTTTLTNIIDGNVYPSSLLTISGSAGDTFNPNAADVKKVEVKISEGSNYWSPYTGWTTNNVWYSSSPSQGSGIYSAGVWMTSAAWTNNITYTIKYKGHDNSRDETEAENGNFEAEDAAHTKTFTYDTERPISTCTYPASPNGQRIVSFATISGTAADVGSNANLRIKPNFEGVNIYDTTSGFLKTLNASQQWVDGDTGLYLPVVYTQYTGSSSSGTWKYTITYPTNVWVNGNNYRIRTRAQDVAGWDESGTVERTFIVDTSSPTSTVAIPTGGSIVSSLPTISVNAPSDTATMKMRLKHVSGGTTFWWTGSWNSGTDDDGSWLSISPSWIYSHADFVDKSAWNHVSVSQGTTFYLRTKAQDDAGNVEEVNNTIIFRFDDDPPTASIAAPPVQYNSVTLAGRYSVLPTISGTCSDAPAGVQTPSGIAFTLTDGTSYYTNSQEWLTAVSTCTATLSANATYWSKGGTGYINNKVYSLKVWGTDSVGNVNY